MNMKKIFLLGLIVALTLTENSFPGGPSPDWKKTEISTLVALPPKINVVPPVKDLSPKVAAFWGRWEGVWDNIDMPVVLIVESISSTTANVFTAREGVSGATQIILDVKPKSSREKKQKLSYLSGGMIPVANTLLTSLSKWVKT